MPDTRAERLTKARAALTEAGTALFAVPCDRRPKLCLSRNVAWSSMNPNLMCPTCAAYWHTTSATNALGELARQEG